MVLGIILGRVAATEPLVAQHLMPETAQKLLAAVSPLGQDSQATTDVEVHSPVLCFCLHKGPETVRELRRLAAARQQQGVAAFQVRQYPQALTAFTQAVQLQPRDARAYTNRGLTYAKMGDYSRASLDLNKAIDLNPQQTHAYYVRAIIALLMGHTTQAQRDVATAVRLGDPQAVKLSDMLSLTPIAFP
jgi:tetratricopeptide (TPR) repeat protein